MNKIPITIGITGHRDIRPDAIQGLKNLVRDEIKTLMDKYNQSEFVMVNALAAGADLLCAEVAMEMGLNLVAVLPMPLDDYITDFSDADAIKLNKALSYASNCINLNIQSDNRDDHYRKAGEYIVNRSHICFALWDGQEATPGGCGTASIVNYMKHFCASYSIYHFKTPRGSDSFNPELKLIESEPGITARILDTTNNFNKDSKADDLYSSADLISIANQKKYTASLISLACAGVAMVLAFLLYDEVYLIWCLLLYAFLLIAVPIFLRFIRKRKYHEKYYQCRMFAESLRVQNVLDGLGIDYNAAESYTWTQQDETVWIKKAIDAAGLLACLDIKPNTSPWIEEQLSYHKNAAAKTERKKRFNDLVSKVLIIITALFIFAGCIVEIAAPQFMFSLMGGIDLGVWYRVLIGTLSAASLFLSSYYGKLALGRKLEDHKNMIRLYSRALNLAADRGLTNSIAAKIAREEIIENGNWYSYIKENAPEINL